MGSELNRPSDSRWAVPHGVGKANFLQELGLEPLGSTIPPKAKEAEERFYEGVRRDVEALRELNRDPFPGEPAVPVLELPLKPQE
jgi:hypothetical protein